jgi:hypothetical protein
MQALTDLFKSERGLLGLALLVAATVLTALGHMSIDQWQTFSMVVFGTYVAGKTASGVAYALTSRPEAMAPESKLDAAAKLAAELLPMLMPKPSAAAPVPFPASVPEPNREAPAAEAAEPSADDVDTDPIRKRAVL